MARFLVCILAAASVLAAVHAEAQSRQDRKHAARAQGVPPGQMPPPGACRVWYGDRSPGRQPGAVSCDRAEAIAARDGRARVIYGEDVYWDRQSRDDRDDRYGRRDGRDDDRAVRRGSVRDPRNGGRGRDEAYGRDDRYRRDDRRDDRYGRDDRDGRDGNPAFRNGYRDGLTKGREDAEDGDRYDAARHAWYRSATRGYDYAYGTRYSYIDGYRRGFEAGYAEGYRVYTRR